MAVVVKAVRDENKSAVVEVTGADKSTVQGYPSHADGGANAGTRYGWQIAMGGDVFEISSVVVEALLGSAATQALGLPVSAGAAVSPPYFHPGRDAWAVSYAVSTTAGKVYLDSLGEFSPGKQTACLLQTDGDARWISPRAYTQYLIENV